MAKLLAAVLLTLLAADTAANVTGTWNMGVQGGHVVPVALVLTQDGKDVTGTIAMPTQHAGERKEVALKGALDGKALTLSGTVDGAADPTTIEISGTLQDDGTMEGTLTINGSDRHSAPWTAERLKERK